MILVREIKGKIAIDVANEMGMPIDEFLDEIFDMGYYCCPKCGKVVSAQQLGHGLNEPCDECKIFPEN